jgi:hypothetical protein
MSVAHLLFGSAASNTRSIGSIDELHYAHQHYAYEHNVPRRAMDTRDEDGECELVS